MSQSLFSLFLSILVLFYRHHQYSIELSVTFITINSIKEDKEDLRIRG